MPLDQTRRDAIRALLESIARGNKPRPIDVGILTQAQFAEINAGRATHGLPTLESAVVIYAGRHHYQSRSADGYTIDDMIEQLSAGLAETSLVLVNPRTTLLKSQIERSDGYGNRVLDEVVLELMARKPKAEAYSVIPKGDKGGPAKKKPLA